MPLTACRPFLLGSGVPRTRLSSALSLGHLGFLHTSSGIFPSSARALGPVQSGPGLLSSLASQFPIKPNIGIITFLGIQIARYHIFRNLDARSNMDSSIPNATYCRYFLVFSTETSKVQIPNPNGRIIRKMLNYYFIKILLT